MNGLMCVALFCGIAVKKEANTLIEHRVKVCIDIVQEAEKQEVEPLLALSVAWRESAFLRNVKSSAGAVGPMQVLPRYWCKKGATCDYIEAGVRALRTFTDMYGEQRGLCAYFSGKPCERAGISASRYRSSIIMRAAKWSELWTIACAEGC